MKTRNATILTLTILAILWEPASTLAQGRQTRSLELPLASPKASVSQTVGLTEITVTYNRPAVKERTIWGGLVPYGQIWRTGANENTVISFSTDVTIEGEPLAAGTYGLHTQPGEEEWQIIFSHDTGAWGSFSYDESRDALRATVKPAAAPVHQEWMLFSFTEADNESATLALAWEKLSVPVKIGIDAHAQTLASLRGQLNGVAKFFWLGPYQAANYCLQEEINYEEALQWTEASIQNEERFENLSLKAELLRKTGDEAQATEILAAALPKGNAGQLFGYAVQLINQDRKQEALDVFKRNVEQNSETWFVEYGLARGYSALGDFDNAIKSVKTTLEKAPEQNRGFLEGQLKRLEKGEDINN